MSQKLPFTGGDFFVSIVAVPARGERQRTSSLVLDPVPLRDPPGSLRPNTTAWDRREEPLRAEVGGAAVPGGARGHRPPDDQPLLRCLRRPGGARQRRRTNAAVNDTLYTLNKGRYEVGKIGENDLLQSELALLRSRNLADAARLEYDRALAALRLALNLPAGAPLEIAVSGEVPGVTADTALAVAEALRNRAAASDAGCRTSRRDRRVTEARLNNGLGATVQASYGFNATGARRSTRPTLTCSRPGSSRCRCRCRSCSGAPAAERFEAAEADQERIE